MDDPASIPPVPSDDDPEAARLMRFAALSSTSAPPSDGTEAERAFTELVAAAGPGLFAFVVRFLGRAEDAEDVCQTVWINVARHAARFDGRARFATWLYRIARNACVDHLRRRGRRNDAVAAFRETGARDGEPAAREPGPPERMARGERFARIMAAVDSLPTAQREVFLLREDAGLTFDEIGRLLGCGRETAKSRMRYALERLRYLLADEVRGEGWR